MLHTHLLCYFAHPRRPRARTRLCLQAVSGKARILESISDKRVADLFTRVDVNGTAPSPVLLIHCVWQFCSLYLFAGKAVFVGFCNAG